LRLQRYRGSDTAGTQRIIKIVLSVPTSRGGHFDSGEVTRRAHAAIGKTYSMIRKLPSGEYRLYSRKKNPKTGRRRNLGTFTSLDAARKHERAVQFFKHGR
jgi:hypothetical protein